MPIALPGKAAGQQDGDPSGAMLFSRGDEMRPLCPKHPDQRSDHLPQLPGNSSELSIAKFRRLRWTATSSYQLYRSTSAARLDIGDTMPLQIQLH